MCVSLAGHRQGRQRQEHVPGVWTTRGPARDPASAATLVLGTGQEWEEVEAACRGSPGWGHTEQVEQAHGPHQNCSSQGDAGAKV